MNADPPNDSSSKMEKDFLRRTQMMGFTLETFFFSSSWKHGWAKLCWRARRQPVVKDCEELAVVVVLSSGVTRGHRFLPPLQTDWGPHHPRHSCWCSDPNGEMDKALQRVNTSKPEKLHCHECVILNSEIQGVFFNWYHSKKLKYGKPRLGESSAT